jgi:hypothetical protein
MVRDVRDGGYLELGSASMGDPAKVSRSKEAIHDDGVIGQPGQTGYPLFD